MKSSFVLFVLLFSRMTIQDIVESEKVDPATQDRSLPIQMSMKHVNSMSPPFMNPFMFPLM